MKNNGEARLFLQELLEWHLELHFIFFERHLHFLSMQYLLQSQLTDPCLLPDVIIEADRRDGGLEGTYVPRCSCCHQLWFHCEHTAARVGLPSCPTDKVQKSWHQRWLLHFWRLDVLDQGQAPWSQRFPNINCWKSWVGERNHFLSLFLKRFCTFSLNVDSILPYTEVASDFQPETLTVFTVTSTNSMNKLVTHWTLVCAWWLLLTNRTV